MHANMDASDYLVCSDPNIWVFDDLLSEAFLDHVDGLFVSREPHQSISNAGGQEYKSSSVEIDIDHHSEALLNAVRAACPFSEVEPCRKVVVSDIIGDIQHPHTDHVSIDDLSRNYSKLDFLDISRQSISKNNATKIVPTYSIVVYFNGVGGIRFPTSKMTTDTISGKRGRIIMFQNYIDAQRPAPNPKSEHYGYYFGNIPKRVLTMGILANETPPMSTGLVDQQRGIPGLIYCPGVLDEPLRHDNPSYHAYGTHYDPDPVPVKKKDDLLVNVSISCNEEMAMVQCYGLSGDLLCEVEAAKETKFRMLRSQIESKIDPDSNKKVQLASADGTLLTKDLDDDRIKDVFGLLSITLKSIKESFAQADLNSDGFLNGAELKALMVEIKKVSPEHAMTEADLDRLFPQVDKDNDERLNVNEFIDWLFGVRVVSDLEAATAKSELEAEKATTAGCKISVKFSDAIAAPPPLRENFNVLQDALPNIKDWTLEKSEGTATFTYDSLKSEYYSKEKKTYKLVLEESMKFEFVYTLEYDGVESLPGDRMEGQTFNWLFSASGTWSMSDGKALLVGEAFAKGELGGSWYRSPPEESYNTATAFECQLGVEVEGQLFK